MNEIESIEKKDLPEESRIYIAENYGFKKIEGVKLITRGLINKTYLICADEDKYVITVFQNKTQRQVEKIVSIMRALEDVPVAKPLQGTNSIIEIYEKPAIVCPFIEGGHAVKHDHSAKTHISSKTHQEVSQLFWEMHSQLKEIEDEEGIFTYDNRDNPEKVAAEFQPKEKTRVWNKKLRKLIDMCEAGIGIKKRKEEIQIAHSDFERQNVLIGPDEGINAILDFDALRKSNIVYEFAHAFYNFICCDPNPKADDADIYLDDLSKIYTVDGSELYGLICLFCLNDIKEFIELYEEGQTVNIVALINHYISALNFAYEYLKP